MSTSPSPLLSSDNRYLSGGAKPENLLSSHPPVLTKLNKPKTSRIGLKSQPYATSAKTKRVRNATESLRDHLVFVLPWRLQYGALGKNELKAVGGGKGLQQISQAPQGSVKDVEELSFEWRRIEKGRQGKTHSSKPFT